MSVCPPPAKDPINLTPSHKGNFSRAWMCDLEGARRRQAAAGKSNPNDAGVAGWVIEAAWAHPFWHSYLLSVVHLREIPGQTEPTIIKFPGATHEICLYALCPDHPREPQIRGETNFFWLSPQNYVGQFVASSDAAAMELAEKAVQDICDGQLSPDTDYRYMWLHRFGDAYYESGKRG